MGEKSEQSEHGGQQLIGRRRRFPGAATEDAVEKAAALDGCKQGEKDEQSDRPERHGTEQRQAKETFARRRRIAAPTTPKPAIIIVQPAGSGTALRPKAWNSEKA